MADAADPDVERLELSGGTLVRIDAPEIGEWSVELSGGGAWTLLAQGNTPLELYEVDFVEENDDIHGGYFAIAGEPIADEDAIVEATLLGPYLTGAFEPGGRPRRGLRDADRHPDRRPGRLQQRRRGARGLGQPGAGLRRPGRPGGEPLARESPMVDLDLADLVAVEDPDGDALELSVESIAQDEPVDGLGSGDTAQDATIGEAGAFALRAERSGTGDGRVYEVTYSASDGRGGECAGTLFVEVPHSVQEPAVDSGERFSSTGSP